MGTEQWPAHAELLPAQALQLHPKVLSSAAGRPAAARGVLTRQAGAAPVELPQVCPQVLVGACTSRAGQGRTHRLGTASVQRA